MMKNVTLEEYFQDQIRDEISIWLNRVAAPKHLHLHGVKTLSMKERHGRNGVEWLAIFDHGLEAKGWISLDFTGFDVIERPDQ